MEKIILCCLNTDMFTFFNHINSNKIMREDELLYHYPNSNIRLIFSNKEINDILLINYCCLSKLFLLIMDIENYLDRIKLFINYLFDEIGIISVSSLVAGLLINNSKRRKSFFHKTNKKYSVIIKNIYGASFDLSILDHFHSSYINDIFPIFVTRDKILYEICGAMKIVDFKNNLPLKNIVFIDETYRKEIIKYYNKKLNERQNIINTTEFLWSKAKSLEEEIFLKYKNKG